MTDILMSRQDTRKSRSCAYCKRHNKTACCATSTAEPDPAPELSRDDMVLLQDVLAHIRSRRSRNAERTFTPAETSDGEDEVLRPVKRRRLPARSPAIEEGFEVSDIIKPDEGLELDVDSSELSDVDAVSEAEDTPTIAGNNNFNGYSNDGASADQAIEEDGDEGIRSRSRSETVVPKDQELATHAADTLHAVETRARSRAQNELILKAVAQARSSFWSKVAELVNFRLSVEDQLTVNEIRQAYERIDVLDRALA